MQVTLIFMAIVMAAVIGWLLKHSLNTQPWVSDEVADADTGTSLRMNPKALGLTTFLAVAVSLFALFVSAYTLRMEEPDWIPVKDPNLLWINTAFLVLASIAYHWTRNQVVAGRGENLLAGLIAAGVLSVIFLLGQLATWQQLQEGGYYVGSNPANAFFYLLTAVHAVHLFGGLYVWGRSMRRVMSGAPPDAVRLSIELCTIYWHFLLLVWVVLFGLLLST
ncbi:MAG: cytochrome c oxidase subunit 3 [Pseudomonadota bacterium]